MKYAKFWGYICAAGLIAFFSLAGMLFSTLWLVIIGAVSMLVYMIWTFRGVT